MSSCASTPLTSNKHPQRGELNPGGSVASVGGALSCRGTQHLSTTPPWQVTVPLREHPYTCVPITMFSRVDFHCSDLPGLRAACFPSMEEGTPCGWQGGWPCSPSTYPITDVKQPRGQPLTWGQWAGTTVLRLLGCDPGERRGHDTPAVPQQWQLAFLPPHLL